MQIDKRTLQRYLDEGLLVKTEHPVHPISIYNYSRKTQYEGNWDEITKKSRSLVLDSEGNFVAKAFDKFFNIEELSPSDIPTERFEVFEKLDGSLILLFYYEGEWIFASKGSFTSDHAILAKKLFYDRYKENLLFQDYVYVFELVGPSNRIVLNYDKDELILLTVICKNDWKEREIEDSLGDWFVKVKKYDGINGYNHLKELIPADKEGFVIKFKSGYRLKIKGEEYVRLHRIISNFSNVTIWEYLKDGKDINELLDRVPDEFDKWVKSVISDLNFHKCMIDQRIGKIYDYFMWGKYGDKEPVTDRKKYAEWVLTKEKWMQPILFRMFDRKNYDDYLWNLMKPKYEKPFWNKES